MGFFFSTGGKLFKKTYLYVSVPIRQALTLYIADSKLIDNLLLYYILHYHVYMFYPTQR